MTTSASLMNFFRVSTSFRKSDGGEIISRSSRFSSLPRTWIPVVPASPSIKTLYFSANRFVVVVAFDRREVGANPRTPGAVAISRVEATENFMLMIVVCECIFGCVMNGKYKIVVACVCISNKKKYCIQK